MSKSQDQIFMQRALQLAAKGRGRVSPNPMVGCVIVKNGKIVAEGWHQRFGGDHAEIVALKKIKFSAQGCTLYVTLEPCAHYGKTPPCVDAVIRAGVKRVVTATRDPNPLTQGRSLQKLKRQGVAVQTGVCKKEALLLNRGYPHWLATGRPYVIAKFAMSLDGKITARHHARTQITGAAAQKYVQHLRQTVDGILVGRKTVEIDDPLLNVRQKSAPQPQRIILDSHLRVKPSAKIFHSHGGKVILCTVLPPQHVKVKRWQKRGVTVLSVPPADGRVDLQALLRLLPTQGVLSVVVEGGAEILASLDKSRCVNEWQILVAPKLFGKAGVAALHSPRFFKKIVREKIRLGGDLLLKLL